MRSKEEIAQRLIRLYRDDAGKMRGGYQLTLNQFKAIAGRIHLHDSLLYDIDAALRSRGFFLLNLGQEQNVVFVQNVETAMHELQTLPDEVCSFYERDKRSDAELAAIVETLTR